MSTTATGWTFGWPTTRVRVIRASSWPSKSSAAIPPARPRYPCPRSLIAKAMFQTPHPCYCGCGGLRHAPGPVRLRLEETSSLGLGSSLGAATESPDAERDERAPHPQDRGFKLQASHKLLDDAGE